MTVPGLLAEHEPSPVMLVRPEAASPFLILCDHAGRRIPASLGTLGLDETDLERHIAWDIGAAGLSERLAESLGATLIMQTYSRLVIDCNRAPGHPTSIARISEATTIPGNAAVSAAERGAREREIFWPYHDRIAAVLDRRLGGAQLTMVIAVHSFTPVFLDVPRPWQAGVLHHRAPELGRALADLLIAEGLTVGDNEPYRLSDESDYTIPVHAERRRLHYVELEVRQDLIAGPDGQAGWAALLSRLLPAAAARLA